MIKSIAIIVQILVIETFCGVSTINPAYYIWINYDAQIPVTPKDNNQYTTKLPCQSRIGKCSYQFTVLPPGWQIVKDGSLNIPSSDATSSGYFAVQGKFSEPTGQKINANLVVSIQNGQLSVVDKQQFYKNNDYLSTLSSTSSSSTSSSSSSSTSSSSLNIDQTTSYDKSVMTKQQPDGFPDLKTIQSQINYGDISNISPIITDILTKYAPCKSRINYLNNLKILLNKTLANNNQHILQQKNDIKDLQDKKKILLNKKNQQFKKLNSLPEVIDLKTKIAKAVIQLTQLKLDIKNISVLSENVMKQMKDYPIDIANLINQQTKQLDLQISKLQSELGSHMNKSLIIQKSIQQTKLKIQSKGLVEPNKTSIQTISQSYTTNLQSYLNKQLNLFNISSQIQNIQDQQNQTSSLIQTLNTKIQQRSMKAKTVQNNTNNTAKLKQIQAQNQVLRKNLDFMQFSSRFLTITCR